MRAFLILFGTHLPCPKCRLHFAEFLQREMRPERLTTRESLVSLMNDCHNEVNRRNGKPEFTLREHYEWMTGRSPSPPPTDFALQTILFIIIATFIYTTGKKLLSQGGNTHHRTNLNRWSTRPAR